MIIRSVVVSGPEVPDASVYFDKGANIIQGGSGTGKSYIVQCIKFALGASTPPKTIKQSVGYTTVRVTFENPDKSSFVVERDFEGGARAKLTDEHGKTWPLATKHSAGNKKNLSSHVLQKLGLDDKILLTGSKSLGSSAFSLRDYEKVFVVDESRVVAEYSPLGTGQHGEKTKEKSILKLLLTGEDDAAVKEAKKELESKGALKHKVDAIEHLIAQFYPEKDGLQLGHIEKLGALHKEVSGRLADMAQDLEITFQSSEVLFQEKTAYLSRLAHLENQLSDDKVLRDRFSMLGDKYESDRQRLLAIEQAAALIEVTGDAICPTCGSDFDAESCTADVEDIQRGVAHELGRIARNLQDLSGTQISLSVAIERNSLDVSVLKKNIAEVESKISSQIQEQVQDISDLKELAACVKYDLAFAQERMGAKDNLVQELKRLGALLLEEQSGYTAESFEDALIPLVSEIQAILQRWSFPEYSPVSFDEKTRDLIIGGSPRGTFGKGHRAVAFSAFVLGLMNLLKLSGRHPGFVVLDSPLTTYKEGDDSPDEERDEVSIDLIYAFYHDIAMSFGDAQVIILENKEPDLAIIPLVNYQHFTKSRSHGRYGFFPVKE